MIEHSVRKQHAALEGVRVLVAEDRSAVAMELCDLLEDAGCTIVGPAARLNRAIELLDERIDVALLDIDLRGEESYPVARRLRERDVPVLLLTGFDRTGVPDDLDDVQLFEKPIAADRLIRSMARLLERP